MATICTGCTVHAIRYCCVSIFFVFVLCSNSITYTLHTAYASVRYTFNVNFKTTKRKDIICVSTNQSS